MKAEQVNKLYKLMTPEELANMTIEAVTKRESYQLPVKELELIKDSVPTALYRLPVWDYRERVRAFFQLAYSYGLHYWRAQALMTATRELINHEQMTESLIGDALQAYKIFCGKLASIEQALAEICTKAKFDIEAVKWVAEVSETEKPLFMPIPPNTELTALEHYRESFHAAAMLDYVPENGA
jgi:hypothetical protein